MALIWIEMRNFMMKDYTPLRPQFQKRFMHPLNCSVRVAGEHISAGTKTIKKFGSLNH